MTRLIVAREAVSVSDYSVDTDTITLLRILHGRRNITRRLIQRQCAAQNCVRSQ